MAANAEAIASALVRAGIEVAFGLGGEVVELIDPIDACRRQGIHFYLTSHESSAAFIAGTTGQLTRPPGVCLATLSLGAANLPLDLAIA